MRKAGLGVISQPALPAGVRAILAAPGCERQLVRQMSVHGTVDLVGVGAGGGQQAGDRLR